MHYFIATPKPSQSSKLSLVVLYYQLPPPPPPPPPPPALFEPRALKSGQGLPRQLGTSNLIPRTLAKLKALGFEIFNFRFLISDLRLNLGFRISDLGFQIFDLKFKICDSRFEIADFFELRIFFSRK